ncbi:hypothetical protein EVAR_4517_1 [Eumeta japonica]|uniref:Uncharacterized protein n=1 Tax=Eumeta variegata TaxID=151549 RepID=A0A4C1SYV1_EUMVA|nr:hypothetical protein EVAR_4517_1 [Eumeta japonica]
MDALRLFIPRTEWIGDWLCSLKFSGNFKLTASGFARVIVEYVPSSFTLPITINTVPALNSGPGTVSDFNRDHSLHTDSGPTLSLDPDFVIDFDSYPSSRSRIPFSL